MSNPTFVVDIDEHLNGIRVRFSEGTAAVFNLPTHGDVYLRQGDTLFITFRKETEQ